MVAISPQTRERIKGYLEGFIEGLVNEYKERSIQKITNVEEYLSRKSSRGDLKPFHAAIIPTEIILINQFERGFSTRLGNSFEECAYLIASEHHQQVSRAYDIKARVSLSAYAEAECQKENYEYQVASSSSKPSFQEMITAVLDARRLDDLEDKKIRADLYILTQDGTEIFFEIKSPKPNKGQCLEVLQRLLRFHLLRGINRPQLQSYYAMTYNPYGYLKEDYKWSYTRNYFPFEEAVLIGNEFWNIIGRETTYRELLEIYQQVGKEKSKYIIDALAFGF